MLFNKESAKKVDVSPGTSCSSSAERRQLAGEEEYPSGVRLVIVVVALVLSIFLTSLDMTIIATAIPRITDEFKSLNDVGWYGSAFFLAVAASQSTWGKAYKHFDLKTVFLITIGIFEIGSLICGVAHNSTTLIVGRAITGLGGAGILAGGYSIIAFSVPPAKRPAFTGVLGATYGVASVVGPLLGGAFTDKATWRWCFYINLPIGVVSAGIIFLVFKTPKQSVSEEARHTTLTQKILHMDLIGAFTIIAAVICLLLALQWGGITKPWNSSDVIGTLIGFGLITIVFVVIEVYQGEHALMAPHILTKRLIYVGCAFNFFLGAAFFVLLYYLPVYFQSLQGISAEQSDIRNLALIIAVTVFTIISGISITLVGIFAPFVIVGSAIATVGAGMIYTLSSSSPSPAWIGYQALAGTGLGLCFQIPIMVGQALAAAEDVTTTTALLMFFQTLGGAFFVSAAQTGFTNQLIKSLGKYAPDISPLAVLQTGVTNIQATFGPDHLVAIQAAYADGLHVVFILVIALAGCSVLISLATPWTSVKGKAVGGAA